MSEQEQQSEKKPEGSEHINLKVTGQDGSVVHFKIKKNTPLRKLMSAYCDRAGLKSSTVRFRFDGSAVNETDTPISGLQTSNVRFRFDGNPINETDTPTGLDMEDGDSIDVFQQQTGGCVRH